MSAEKSLLLGDRAISYSLRRSRRKTLGLRIDGRGLVVAIPERVGLSEAEAFIRSHTGWILDKLALWQQRAEEPAQDLADGAELPVLGRPCVLRWTSGGARTRWVEGLFARELHLAARKGSDQSLVLKRALQAYALNYFAGRLDEYLFRLQEFAPGIMRPRLALTSARTRWGSCSSRTGIRLHWRLVHLAPALVDYVVAHEVGHLVEMNHSPRFWSVVEALCPDWREARAALARERLPEI